MASLREEIHKTIIILDWLIGYELCMEKFSMHNSFLAPIQSLNKTLQA